MLGTKTKVLLILWLLFMAVLPFVMPNQYYLGNLIIVGLYTLVGIGLCLLMGFAGQVSLGHAAFYGLGAYSSALLTVHFDLSPVLALVAAAVLTGLIAFFLGIPAMRLEEHYLALATLGWGIIVFIFFNEQTSLTGGPSGFSGIPYFSIGPLVFSSDMSFYYLVLAVVALGMLLAYNLVHSRMGRALRALRTSEAAAQSLGIATSRYKNRVFVISAVYASISGSLYCHYVTFISPSPFGFQASIEFVLIAVVGGLASIFGPVFGAAAVIALTEGVGAVMPKFFPYAGSEFEIIIYGCLLVIIMIFVPEGLTAALKKKRLRDKIEFGYRLLWRGLKDASRGC